MPTHDECLRLKKKCLKHGGLDLFESSDFSRKQNGPAERGCRDLGQAADQSRRLLRVMDRCLCGVGRKDLQPAPIMEQRQHLLPNVRHPARHKQTCRRRGTLYAVKVDSCWAQQWLNGAEESSAAPMMYNFLLMFSIYVVLSDGRYLWAILKVTDVEMEDCLLGSNFLTIDVALCFSPPCSSMHPTRRSPQPTWYLRWTEKHISAFELPCRSALNAFFFLFARLKKLTRIQKQHRETLGTVHSPPPPAAALP